MFQCYAHSSTTGKEAPETVCWWSVNNNRNKSSQAAMGSVKSKFIWKSVLFNMFNITEATSFQVNDHSENKCCVVGGKVKIITKA